MVFFAQAHTFAPVWINLALAAFQIKLCILVLADAESAQLTQQQRDRNKIFSPQVCLCVAVLVFFYFFGCLSMPQHKKPEVFNSKEFSRKLNVQLSL